MTDFKLTDDQALWLKNFTGHYFTNHAWEREAVMDRAVEKGYESFNFTRARIGTHRWWCTVYARGAVSPVDSKEAQATRFLALVDALMEAEGG